MNVLVIGSNGQLASELKVVSTKFPLNLYFTSSAECDIRNKKDIEFWITKTSALAVINTAAYTAVDNAEDDVETAYAINESGVRNLDAVANEKGIKYIHISTDYVFDGSGKTPYSETSATNPIGVYGKSKRAGELVVLGSNADCIVIRTAWLYSTFGSNFMKTMLKLAENRGEISVVNDQIGTPTYTRDLAETCLQILSEHKRISSKGKLYHFANSGSVSWFDFAQEIFSQKHISCRVNPIPSSQYPTKAIRPKYSVLSTDKIRDDFHIQIRDWKEALIECLELLT